MGGHTASSDRNGPIDTNAAYSAVYVDPCITLVHQTRASCSCASTARGLCGWSGEEKEDSALRGDASCGLQAWRSLRADKTPRVCASRGWSRCPPHLHVAAPRDHKRRWIRDVDLLGADDDVAEVAARGVGAPVALGRGEGDEAGEDDAVQRYGHVEVVPAGGVVRVEEGEEAEAGVHAVALRRRQGGKKGREGIGVGEGREHRRRRLDALVAAAERGDDLKHTTINVHRSGRAATGHGVHACGAFGCVTVGGSVAAWIQARKEGRSSAGAHLKEQGGRGVRPGRVWGRSCHYTGASETATAAMPVVLMAVHAWPCNGMPCVTYARQMHAAGICPSELTATSQKTDCAV